jgi:HEPN domain-containing protein
MTRIFTVKDGLKPADLVHCALDHLSAADFLFKSGPHHFDSAGYLAHIGIEMLLKGWLLQTNKSFEGTHNLISLHKALVEISATKELNDESKEVLVKLDGYEQLRYPNLNSPTEVVTCTPISSY